MNRPLDAPLLVLPILSADQLKDAPRGSTVLTREKVSAAALRNELSDPRKLVVLWGHGHEDQFFLAGDVLGSERRAPSGLPSQEWLETGAVKARTLFINTCNGLKLAGGFLSDEQRLGVRLLEGWPASYISSYLSKDSESVDALLFYRLVQQGGFGLAEAVTITNNFLLQGSTDLPCYLLVGEAGASEQDNPSAPLPCELEDCGDFMVLRAGKLDVSFAHFVVYDARLNTWAAQEGVVVYSMATKTTRLPASVFFAAVPRSDSSRVDIILFSWGDAELDEVSLELRPAAGVFGVAQSLIPAVSRGIEEASLMGVYYTSKLKGPTRNLLDKAKSVGELGTRGRYDLDASLRAKRGVSELVSETFRIQSEWLDHLLSLQMSGAFPFTEKYIDAFVPLERAYLGEVCPYCEDGLAHKRVGHGIYTDRVRREIRICSSCGIICDKPVDSHHVELLTPSEGAENPAVARVRFRNGNVRGDVCLAVGIALEQGRRERVACRVTPRQQSGLVGPGETIEMEFALDFYQARQRGLFYAKGFLIGNMSIYCLRCPVLIDR